MTRKYRNGKASGEPKRDLKYSPEYLAYRQSRGGESVKVSQCDLDLDGTADSIVSAWRHPAVGKSEHCGDPYLFWPVTGISTLLNPHSPPTGIQTHASPQGDQAPTGIGLEIDMDEDGAYAGPNNLPPYDFDDNDDTVGAITLLNSVDQGPTGISTIAPLQNANSGPTGISLQIDMDEDGAYAPDDFDDTDNSVQVAEPFHFAEGDILTNTLATDVDLEMLYVEPGTFTMGSHWSETGHQTDETRHQVTLTKGFCLGKYEVTQAQYEAVMTGNTDSLSTTPSFFGGNPNRPVEQVSWNDIQIFLTRLNAQQSANIPAGWSYVLPTESQWEYACRAGTTTAYSWGATIATTNANSFDAGTNQTSNVGDYAANPWGFFDMHGNVFEWTADWYGSYPSGSVTDPIGPASGSERVIRGGSWRSRGRDLRSATRVTRHLFVSFYNLGFRVALVPSE